MMNVLKISKNVEQKNMLYILFGVLLEKAFPFIIAFIFIRYINNTEFGMWVIYFQIILIFASTIISPLQLFFNREFNKVNFEKIKIYNFQIIAPVFIFFLLIFYVLFDVLFLHLVLSLLSVVTLILNNLLFNYLRFNDQNLKYLLFSFFRFICFLILLSSFVIFNDKLQIEGLFIALILSNLIVIIVLRKLIEIKTHKYKIQEFFKLCSYGILTLSLGGLDKLILLYTNLDILDLATLGYALIFANSTSVMVEVIKKYFSPIYFKNFNDLKFYSRSTVKRTIQANVFLVFFQVSFPFILFFILDYFQFTKDSLIGIDFLYLLLLLSISLSIHNLYHFINPYLFYINKSHYLSLIIILTALVFVISIFSVEQMSLVKLAFYKIISSLLLITLSFLCIKFLRQKNNV
tara:strand:+ start:2834 stop:4048 length:1215 start_codon:yes stop_codon:yes gene_type:complete